MPVLDTAMWVGREQRESGIPPDMLDKEGLVMTRVGELKDVVLYRFYQKPMTNLLVNLASNAAPDQMKISTVTNEIIRRFKTTSRDLHPSVIEGVLLKYMEELRIGGHTLKFRREVLDAACRGYQRMWEREIKGEGKINRPEKASRLKRRHAKLVGKSIWFKGTSKEDTNNVRKT